MPRKTYVAISVVLTALVLACSTVMGALRPSPTPTATATPRPTATSTAIPTSTLAPTLTPTPRPSATPSCEVNQVLARLKSIHTYDEIVINYQVVRAAERVSLLNVWFVDPEIDPQASGAKLKESAVLAVRHTAALAHQHATADPCVSTMAAIINPFAVDRNYNGWFSGNIPPSALPASDTLTEQQTRTSWSHSRSHTCAIREPFLSNWLAADRVLGRKPTGNSTDISRRLEAMWVSR